MKTQKYKVIVNWYGENRTFFTKTSTPHKALENAITQLSKKTKTLRPVVRRKVLNGKASWEIKEIKKKENE